MDDILMYGGDQKAHDQRLVNVLQRLAAAGTKLNGDKCEFSRVREIFGSHPCAGLK